MNIENIKIKKLRFTEEEDHVLLREVRKYNPFRDPEKWINIFEKFRTNCFSKTDLVQVEFVTRDFKVRALMDRLKLLMQWFSTCGT